MKARIVKNPTTACQHLREVPTHSSRVFLFLKTISEATYSTFTKLTIDNKVATSFNIESIVFNYDPFKQKLTIVAKAFLFREIKPPIQIVAHNVDTNKKYTGTLECHKGRGVNAGKELLVVTINNVPHGNYKFKEAKN